MTINLVPAYGRDYKSKAEVQKDFDDDKDFRIEDMSSKYDGKYVNRPQLVEAGYTSCTIRYKKLTMVTIIKVPRIIEPK